MIRQYQKKPVVIEAVQWTGKNISEVSDFIKNKIVANPVTSLIIHTLEGDMIVSEGDYIIKGVDGEYYPCKSNIFEKTYLDVTEQE